MLKSFNDWICTVKVFERTERLLKEDILDDRAFPESTSKTDMLRYLRKVNAGDSFIRAFERLYRRYYRAEIRPLNQVEHREAFERYCRSIELELPRPDIKQFKEQKNNMKSGMYKEYKEGANNDNIQTVVHEKPY